MPVNEQRIEAFSRYISSVRSRATASAYERGARELERYIEQQNLALESAPRGLLRGFTARLVDTSDWAPATVRLMLHGAKRYVEYLRDEGVEIPDLSSPEMPKDESKVPIVLYDAALAAYFRVASTLQEPTRTALMMLPLSGLRSDEVVRLRPEQIDTKQVDDEGRQWIFLRSVTGKGKKSRDVILLRDANPILKSYLQGFHQNRSEWLFPGKNGNHLATRTLRKNMQRVRRELGINHLTPHTLRRTYSTILRDHGINDSTVADLMGHEKVDTTRRHYYGKAVRGTLRQFGRIEVPEDENA